MAISTINDVIFHMWFVRGTISQTNDPKKKSGKKTTQPVSECRRLYSVSFTIADCLMGDDSTQVLALGVRSVSNLCPAGDRDTFALAVHAGNFTLTVDVGLELSAPLTLKATLRLFDNAQNRNLTVQRLARERSCIRNSN
jgi:hypothetical protein